MEISKKLQNYCEKNNIQSIINDCESIIDEIKIKDMIYEIRGRQVMLDSEISATK